MLLRVSAGVLLGSLLALGDVLSYGGGFAGSYFQTPGSPDPASPVTPANMTVDYSTGVSAGGGLVSPYTSTFTFSGMTNGTLTTTGVTMSGSLSGSGGFTDTQQDLVQSFSGVTFQVQGPVYLEETLTFSRSFTSGLNLAEGEYWGGSASVGFFDSTGTQIGTNCLIGAAVPTSLTTTSCSTGLVAIGAGSTITVENNLAFDTGLRVPGDSYNFSGTATLGPLLVYDSNGSLIESIDLNGVAAPEPDCSPWIIAGTFGIVAWRRRMVPAR